ncbi:MAG TPA: twin-arginine translocase TatA/TatE family subunit [Anaeromyxobacteraceae bacterium]|nr:twin-arginine translocase TatA/TatE family subunit [Anaeromyxobacteraceae bacterium]
MHMGFGELLIVFIVVMLVFGANKIPQLGDALGKGIRNFKKAQHEDEIDVTPQKSAAQLSQNAPTAAAQQTSAEAKKV